MPQPGDDPAAGDAHPGGGAGVRGALGHPVAHEGTGLDARELAASRLQVLEPAEAVERLDPGRSAHALGEDGVPSRRVRMPAEAEGAGVDPPRRIRPAAPEHGKRQGEARGAEDGNLRHPALHAAERGIRKLAEAVAHELLPFDGRRCLDRSRCHVPFQCVQSVAGTFAGRAGGIVKTGS